MFGCVWFEKTSIWNFCEIFIKIWFVLAVLEKIYSWFGLVRFGMVWYGMVWSGLRQHPTEASVKFSSRSNIGNPVKNPPLLHVSLRSLKGHRGSWITWRCVQMNWSQMDPEMVSDEWENSYEANVRFSSRSNIRNPVKTPTVPQISNWSLGGHGGSWCT